MNYIVVGCGRVGAELAYSLYQKGHKVSVIDQASSAFFNLHTKFRGRMIEGEALNQDVLMRAGIENADGLAAVTNSDPLNAVVAHVAKIVYEVPRIVVRNYDPHWKILHETFGHHMVSSSSWGAQRVEEMLDHPDMHAVYSAGNGEVEVYEFIIPENWDNRRLKELLPDSNCIPVSLTRAGNAMLPTADVLVKEGDVLLVSATVDGIMSVRQLINTPQES